MKKWRRTAFAVSTIDEECLLNHLRRRRIGNFFPFLLSFCETNFVQRKAKQSLFSLLFCVFSFISNHIDYSTNPWWWRWRRQWSEKSLRSVQWPALIVASNSIVWKVKVNHLIFAFVRRAKGQMKILLWYNEKEKKHRSLVRFLRVSKRCWTHSST